MQKAFYILLIAVAVLSSCKKSNSDETTPPPNGQTCKVVTMTQSVSNTLLSTSLFLYDNSGNIQYIKQITPTGDTILVFAYKYSNNVLQYSVLYEPGLTDTTYFHYNSQNNLTETNEYIRTSSSVKSIKANYFYNSANQVILYKSLEMHNSITGSFDSVLYTYSGNNITTEDHYSKYGAGPFDFQTIYYSYDNKKNLYKTLVFQPISPIELSENNVTQMRYADSTNVYLTRTFLDYNASGYPTNYTQQFSSSPSLTFEYSLLYQCP
jgi:hypothetical protein